MPIDPASGSDDATDFAGPAGTLYLVHVLTHGSRTRLDALLVDHGLSSFHYTVMSVIERHAGISSSRLSRRFHITPQAMGEVIVSLHCRGLIERNEDPNHRKILCLSLTPGGRERLIDARGVVTGFEATVFAGISADKLAEFRATLAAALSRLRGESG